MDVNLPGRQFKICLVEINTLRPHEEVIEHQVCELASEMRMEKKVRDPLLVDDKNLVILDGMHRYDSLRKLGCISAPCCLLDYDAPEIKVGSWYRFLNIANYDSVAQQTLDGLHLTYEREENIENENIDCNRTLMVTKRTVFRQKEATGAIYKAKLAVRIERVLLERGFEIQYEPENVIDQRLRFNMSNIAIPVPIFTKMEIRRVASSGQLLPHKLTRHFVPSRPLRLNIPLPLLQGAENIEEANRKLDSFLSKMRMDRRPGGSIVDGRRYQEELLVFET
jgi:hypothetical protein